MLAALKDMYGEMKLRVRAGGELGGKFRSDRGVKQGDPLSPLYMLFELLLERIERFFYEDLDGYGVSVGGSRVSMLLFADDLAIIGEDAGTVQRVLYLLSRCCSCLHMKVSVSKTVGMVLNPRVDQGPAVYGSYNAQQVEMVHSFKYSGTQGVGWARQGSEAKYLPIECFMEC